MKYKVEICVRGMGVQLLPLTEEEKDQLLGVDLDEVYEDWVEEKECDFYLEGVYLGYGCDRFGLTITDENGNVVFKTSDLYDLRDLTYINEDGDSIKGWEFKGVDEGIYLTRTQTLKGVCHSGEFELDEPFDKDKLYIIQDTVINDELLGDDIFQSDVIYYQRGVEPSLEDDVICVDEGDDGDEQYHETYLMDVTEGDWWHDLNKDNGLTKQQLEQISSLHKIIVDDNGYAFLTLNRDGNILKAEDEDYSLNIEEVKSLLDTQHGIFSDICYQIIKDTYSAHKFDYDNAVEHKRKINFSYCINEHQASMVIEISAKNALQHLGLIEK